MQNTWVEVRHPTTGKLAGRYCPQTHQFEIVDRRERGVIALPPQPLAATAAK